MTTLGRVRTVLPALILPVLLTACGPSSDSPSSGGDVSPVAAPTGDARTAAEAFLAFAESGHEGSDVPWSDTVVYSVGGDQVAQLGPDFADRRSGWVRCPGGATSYAGRACPVSPLGVLWSYLSDDGEPVLDAEVPDEVGCTDYRAPWRAEDVAWIRPGEDDPDCEKDFAIAIAVDDAGDVVAVDLTLGLPTTPR